MTAIQRFEQINIEYIARRDAGTEPTYEECKAFRAAQRAAAAQLISELGLRVLYDKACTAVKAEQKYARLARTIIGGLIDDITFGYPVMDLSTPTTGLCFADLRDPQTIAIVIDRAHCALKYIGREYLVTP